MTAVGLRAAAGLAALVGAIPLLTSLFIFGGAPLITLCGLSRYTSPTCVLAQFPGSHEIALHTGNSFDWIPLIRKVGSGRTLKNRILADFTQGLLCLLDDDTVDQSTELFGESWFFNPRTAQRLGFDVHDASLNTRLSFLMVWPELVLMASLTEGRLRLPSPSRLKRATTTIGRLQQHRALLERLNVRLRRSEGG